MWFNWGSLHSFQQVPWPVMLKFQNKPDFFDKPLSCTFKHIESHSLGPPKVWQEGGLQERDPETGTWCWDQISTAKWCKSAWERSRVRGGQVLQVHSMSRTGLPWEKGLVVYSLHGWRKKTHIYIVYRFLTEWIQIPNFISLTFPPMVQEYLDKNLKTHDRQCAVPFP